MFTELRRINVSSSTAFARRIARADSFAQAIQKRGEAALPFIESMTSFHVRLRSIIIFSIGDVRALLTEETATEPRVTFTE